VGRFAESFPKSNFLPKLIRNLVQNPRYIIIQSVNVLE